MSMNTGIWITFVVALWVGSCCFSYLIGRMHGQTEANASAAKHFSFTKTHVAAIKDQLTMGSTNMSPDSADRLLTPDQ